LTPLLPLQGTTLLTNSRQYVISNTRVLSPTKVNEFRSGYTTLFQHCRPRNWQQKGTSMRSGLTTLIGYTWSRAMNNGSAIRGTSGDQFAEDPHCLRCEYGPSACNCGVKCSTH